MSNHNTNPVKFCLTCRTHFKADPDEHEAAYHPDGRWFWKSDAAEPHEQYP